MDLPPIEEARQGLFICSCWHHISISFKLEFVCSAKEVYEVLIVELVFALQMGFHRLRVQGDSKLIIKHVRRGFSLQ